MPYHVLDQNAPGLSEKLRGMRPEAQREIIVRAALFAETMRSELDLETRTVLQRLASKRYLSPEEAASVLAMAEAADDRYFDLLAQEASTDKWEKPYSSARLLRGIAVGFGAVAQEDIADSIYEISGAVKNYGALLAFIESEVNALASR